MNQLTKFLVEGILGEEKKEIVALYAGGFKPPTAGHFQVVEETLKQYPEIDKLVVLVGSGVRDGIEQAESLLVWEIYQNYLPMKVEIQAPKKPPINAVYSYAKDNPEETIYWVLGAREGKDEDLSDITKRTAAIDKKRDKYNNVEVKIITTANKGMSGTNARKALQDGDQETFFKFIPSQVEKKEEIFNILRPAVTETSNPNDGKAAPFGSGYDEVKEQVNFKSLESQLDDMFAELDIDVAFTNHFKERVIERGLTEEDIIELANKIIDKYPDELDFLDKDQNIVMSHLSRLVDIAAVNTGYGDDYLKDLVFKTAFKRKDKSEPEFRTNKSSPRLSVTENTMKGKIDILPKIGELTLYMIDNGMNVEPLPTLEIIEDDTTNAEDFFGKTAYYDPYKKHIVLYTHGRHPKDIVRSYAHEMIHHIQNLEGRLGDITTTNTQEDDSLNDIEAEANLNGTMTFRNWTDSLQENKDPFGLLEDILSEGRYDKFVNQLSRIAFETIKDGFESGKNSLNTTFTVRPEEDEPDIESDMFEFDFQVVADYTQDVYKVDGGANEGIDDDGIEITPLLIINFSIPKNPKWSTVSMDLKDVVRHELEHLTQSGDNVVGIVTDPQNPELNRPGKQMEDDQFIRKMIDSDVLPKAEYFKLEKEVDAMLQGLYFKAKKSKHPFKDVIDDYLATQPISQQEKEVILNLWRSRNKALSLPVFENKEEIMTSYTIYSDMDGVITDFEKRFKDFSNGMEPRDYENKFGKEKFWELIDVEVGVPFFAGMDWMPDGKTYWNHIKKYNPILLSAPSRKEESKYGKRIWKKRNMPSTTKLILTPAWKKQEYASPTSILIDDREKNIEQWQEAGGIGIHHTSASNTIAQLKKLGL
jgi:hypothetical protein